MSETRIISPYSAIIDGKKTGLAGCGSASLCDRAAYCLRADFAGDDADLISCIEALLALDKSGSLAPHGIGGLARGLLSAAAVRLQAATHRALPDGFVPVPVCEVVSLRRDAARYKWLRESDAREMRPFIAIHAHTGFSVWTGNYADAAIDAAMLQAAQEKSHDE